ncbi:TIGR03620 family F420-dependent LLM class oxidoreductase [Spirillospora sp. NPDC029432]|uniref:TIGR03620 family F420-dependent LLM class oxidoreductase n=1 Tax=Spirillospora sp. NPDC029432 TaxID=3154599 RepID=UPI0034541816
MTDMGHRDLGRVGLWTFAFDGQPAGRVREAAAEIEELGYGAVWFGEAFGRDTAGQAWLLLSATRRLVAASGIANIALRDPIAMATAERTLAEAFPGRYVLGLGGHRVDDTPGVLDGYTMPSLGRAVRTMTGYLDRMDALPVHSVPPAVPPRRVLAALGPKMLELAGRRAWGAHPYFVPVRHTARAREIMGPGRIEAGVRTEAFLAVEQAVVLDTDPGRAREVARAHVAGYLQAPHQVANLRRLGYGDADLAGGPGDRLVDEIVAYGDAEVIRRRVREHLDAGADHVCLQVLTADPAALPLPEWRELAAALLH